jgi:hypothetical protein
VELILEYGNNKFKRWTLKANVMEEYFSPSILKMVAQESVIHI